MKTYRVIWQIDVDAADPVEAAKLVRKIQLDPNSITNTFEVIPTQDDQFTGDPSPSQVLLTLDALDAYQVDIA